jgi:1-acyl-sn-glycerol-3-phosphate acyltransferase
MFWKFLRSLFLPYIKFYFRRSKGKNLDVIKTNSPVLIALNHPNAFIDSIAFSCILYQPRTYYMARGDAFKKGFISYVLTSTGIIPIFRLRDGGIEGVKKNNESFSIAYKMWNKGKKIIVFPEGLCIQERRLRPIQKGTARMAFGFSEEMKRDDFLIIPVSVTYSHPSKFGSDIYYEAGNPIPVKNYLSTYKTSPAKAVNDLTRDLEIELKKITPHLTNKEYDTLLEQLQEIYKYQFLAENNLEEQNLENHQKFWFFITEKLNELNDKQPEKLEKLKKITSNYSNLLIENNILDKSIYLFSQKKSLSKTVSLLLLVLGFPVYVTAKIVHFAPKFLAELTAKKTCKNIEFFASVNFVTGAFYSLFYLVFEFIVLWFIFHQWIVFLIYLGLKVVFSFIALSYSRNAKFLLSELRVKSLNRNKKNKLEELLNLRKQLVESLV